MFAKLFVVAFLALFACQGAVDAKTTTFALSPRAQRGLIDAIQEAIRQIRELVAKLVAEAKEAFEKLIEAIKEQAEAILGEAHEIISAIVEDIKAKIQELIQHAQEVQASVIECVQGQMEAIEALKQAALDGVRNCVGDKIEEAKAIIEHAKAEISALIEKAIELEGKFRECNGGVTCLLAVASEAFAVIKGIPETAKEIIQEVIELVGHIQEEVPACLTLVASDLASKGQAIVTDIRECIDDKINN